MRVEGTGSKGGPVAGRGSAARPEGARRRYFEAVLGELDSRPPNADHSVIHYTYEDLYRRAGNKSPSTLYYTFGGAAKGALARRFPRETQLAFGLPDVVLNVVMELKALSHWPYRQGWLDELTGTDDRRHAAETLVRVLAGWASVNPRLAAHGGYMPPASAVEDLSVVCRQQAPAAAIAAFLRRVLMTAVGSRAASPADVLDVVHAELMTVLGFDRPRYVLELVHRLGEPLGELEYLIAQLRPDDRARVGAALLVRLDGLREVIGEEGP